MTHSMTGFGRSIISRDGREIQVELKSVNHRYLDISMRLPRALGAFEETVRKILGSSLARGHIDVFISYRNTGQSAREVLIDLPLLGAYLDAFALIRERFPTVENDLTFLGISRLPDVLTVADAAEDDQIIGAMLEEALEEAVRSVCDMRLAEGKHLLDDIKKRLDLIKECLIRIELRAPGVVLEHKEKLAERIAFLMQGNAVLDENRLQAEVAVFADRCSITEEIVRLKSHLSQFVKTAGNGGPVGRKLDFMVQEMNREANTIGSKANDLEITNAVLEIKGEIEKIREQVQNIE